MRFEQLRYFDTAVRSGSLRHAANLLNLSQPTVTHQIQRLEEELNVVLLFRGPTGVTPTEAGRALLPNIRKALRAENELQQEAGAITGLHRGRLRLGAIPLVGQLFLPFTIRSFRNKYPGIEFVVTEAGSGAIIDKLRTGELDLGIAAHWDGRRSSEKDMRMEILTGGVYTVCVPPNHRLATAKSVTVHDLAGESFVVVQHGQVLREVFEEIASEIEVSIIYETNYSHAARRIVDAGVGITLQSAFFDTSAAHSSVAIPLAEPWSYASVVLARRWNEQPTPAMSTFMQLMRESVRNFQNGADTP